MIQKEILLATEHFNMVNVSFEFPINLINNFDDLYVLFDSLFCNETQNFLSFLHINTIISMQLI